jgi:hypothetical protein
MIGHQVRQGQGFSSHSLQYLPFGPPRFVSSVQLKGSFGARKLEFELLEKLSKCWFLNKGLHEVRQLILA